MVYCPKCGKAVRKGVKFCPSCGATISAAVPAKAAEAPAKAPEPTRAPAPRKIGAGVVILIVGIIAVIVIAAILLLRGGGTGLPVYSGANKLGGQSAGGYTAEFYSFTGSGQDVYNWYKTQMVNEGWTLGSDSGYASGYGGALTYTKGNEMAVIEIIEESSTISYYEQGFNITVPSGSKLIVLMKGPSGGGGII